MKKGVGYIIMSLILVGIIVANMAVFTNRFRRAELASVQLIQNEFIENVIEDISRTGLERFLAVAGKEALATMGSRRTPGLDADADFAELVFNGSFDGTLYHTRRTLERFLGATTRYYVGLGFTIDKVNITTNLTQPDPWLVEIDANVTYHVSVARVGLSWVIDVGRRTNVSIFGVQDPSGAEGIITRNWVLDNTFPSFLERLQGLPASGTFGICNVCS